MLSSLKKLKLSVFRIDVVVFFFGSKEDYLLNVFWVWWKIFLMLVCVFSFLLRVLDRFL